MAALSYLQVTNLLFKKSAHVPRVQGELSDCVNHKDKVEEKEFQLLAGSIFNQV